MSVLLSGLLSPLYINKNPQNLGTPTPKELTAQNREMQEIGEHRRKIKRKHVRRVLDLVRRKGLDWRSAETMEGEGAENMMQVSKKETS